jgi:endonuclease/exonuclease/phosphatase family metal-dependent hydrolase
MVPALPGDHFKVVNWNIKFGEKIDKAIEAFRDVEALKNADLILLQEMDEDGVKRIAYDLGLNYVYYPASIHDRTGRAFGNAILARWPMHSYQRCFYLIKVQQMANVVLSLARQLRLVSLKSLLIRHILRHPFSRDPGGWNR